MEKEDSPETVLSFTSFTRRSLYDLMKESKGKKMDERFLLLQDKLVNITRCPVDKKKILKRALKFFKTQFKQRWTAAERKEPRFLNNNEEWRTSSIQLPYFGKDTAQKLGRPIKSFEELSERSKRRKTMELRKQVPSDELVYAASVSQRTSGNSDASVMIKKIMESPTRASKIRKSISVKQQIVNVKKHTPEQALSIFVEGDFTRRQWEIIQSANKNIYPCYSLIQKAKKQCYPKKETIRVTETCIEVQLQALLDHTVTRLMKYLTEVIESCTKEEKNTLELIIKWGCDGSQQFQFKQKFENTTDSDANIFQSSLVPLRLVVRTNGKVIWQNPTPSSVRFCRPVRIRFISENKDVIKEEITYVESQIENLTETHVPTSDGIAKIKHTMLFTMIDGKVCNAATDTSSTMRCYICGQTSKDFNKLNKGQQIKAEAIQFGLSVLHARIRFFESLLHLAYKLPIRKWQARSPSEKKLVKETKERIQTEFKQEMGLLVDIPKAGLGNTNDGNTSRRFFSDPETSSRITGIDVHLIKRMRIILEAISSGNSVDANKFDAFAHETAKMYVSLYKWHPMSPTVHKILIHGAQIISSALLPIGQLSKEAAEARNKNFRQYRQDFARKFSRVDCNMDILNRLLLSSDPYLSSIRPKLHKRRQPFSKEALDLMVAGSPLESSLNTEIDNGENDKNKE